MYFGIASVNKIATYSYVVKIYSFLDKIINIVEIGAAGGVWGVYV